MPDRRRTVLTIAGTAVGSIAVGFLAARSVVSPAESAARAAPPAAEPVTVPVEHRTIQSRVVTRGDTSFEGAVDVVVATADLGVPPVVTGRVPDVGATIEEGAVLVEVVGRPVIVVAGPLPMYRTLRPGMHGPDVAQLEEVLGRLGVFPGDTDDRYEAATGEAVAELFRRSGYEPPAMPSTLVEELEAAREALAGAEQAVASAEAALRAASADPPESERLAAWAAVREAELALHAAAAARDPAGLAAAEDQLRIAVARREELSAARDTALEAATARAAHRTLERARDRVGQLEATVGTPTPAAELVFLPTLPRRVDKVDVVRGALIDGPVMVLSGADLRVTARVSDAQRQLLTEGMAAILELGSSLRADGAIASITEAPEDEAGYDVRITPGQLSTAQHELLRGANVRVTIPVETTDGEVLAVPLAALSAGAGGESRVEVRRDDGRLELVVVEVGLAAEGYAEIRPRDGALGAGDRVVVGR
ncbi:MAG: peptidoglycan-binding protein [Acidimicrobiales bacterium]